MFKAANNDNISRPNSRPKLPFPGNGKGNLKLPWEGKFEACIPGNHGKREFPLTPDAVEINGDVTIMDNQPNKQIREYTATKSSWILWVSQFLY